MKCIIIVFLIFTSLTIPPFSYAYDDVQAIAGKVHPRITNLTPDQFPDDCDYHFINNRGERKSALGDPIYSHYPENSHPEDQNGCTDVIIREASTYTPAPSIELNLTDISLNAKLDIAEQGLTDHLAIIGRDKDELVYVSLYDSSYHIKIPTRLRIAYTNLRVDGSITASSKFGRDVRHGKFRVKSNNRTIGDLYFVDKDSDHREAGYTQFLAHGQTIGLSFPNYTDKTEATDFEYSKSISGLGKFSAMYRLTEDINGNGYNQRRLEFSSQISPNKHFYAIHSQNRDTDDLRSYVIEFKYRQKISDSGTLSIKYRRMPEDENRNAIWFIYRHDFGSEEAIDEF